MINVEKVNSIKGLELIIGFKEENYSLVIRMFIKFLFKKFIEKRNY